ncbi:MAG TPA: class I SAM-dependent methyltransferase [Solirubrobacteraceae bacterium]|jgi:hypothetical protein
MPEDRLGYVSHSTINVGDDFQAIAARQFLPADAVAVDREFIAEFTHASRVRAVVSGWFMHEGRSYWDLPVAPPARSWPPSPVIDPLFISLHLTATFHDTVFAPEHIDYLRQHAPIGARDTYTLQSLQEHDIPSYYSGCLTLTLPSASIDTPDSREVVFVVDAEEAVAQHVRLRTSARVETITHGRAILQLLRPQHRLQYAEHILRRYERAKCVVTTRLHAALPCLALGTPVLLLPSKNRNWPNPRLSDYLEHLWHTSEEELLAGEFAYAFDDPPPNPTTYLPLRGRLSRSMRAWVGRGGRDESADRHGAGGEEAPAFDGRFERCDLVSSVIKPGDVGVEIGVLLGTFAYHVLLPAQPAQLYLIDPWLYGLQPDLEPDPTPEKQVAADHYCEFVRRLFAQHSNVEILRMRSQDAAARFADGSLDYVYIDGEHSHEAVTRDLRLYFPKVRAGGHLMGDDYGWSGVGAAVEEFLAAHVGELKSLVDPYATESGGQFVLRKRAAGAF